MGGEEKERRIRTGRTGGFIPLTVEIFGEKKTRGWKMLEETGAVFSFLSGDNRIC